MLLVVTDSLIFLLKGAQQSYLTRYRPLRSYFDMNVQNNLLTYGITV